MNIPSATTTAPNPDQLLDWSLPSSAHHNVRALCDIMGLTFQQKQILSACVMQESGFQIKAIHPNYAFTKEGVKYLASTDYGIVQVNDYWHIGAGKDFPNVAYVYANPEACVRWMIHYYKVNGHLNAWCSYTSGDYKQYLGRV